MSTVLVSTITMSAATAVKTTSPPPAEQEGTLSDGDRSEIARRAWRGLLRAHACLAKRLDAELEREHGLPLSSYEVLGHLDDAGAGRMRMSDLADQAQLSRSGLTRLVDRLERDGLLERCSCEHDARGAYACLTDLGRERLAQARTTQLAVVREHFFSHFSELELGALADMWERIAPCGSNGNGHAAAGGCAANGHVAATVAAAAGQIARDERVAPNRHVAPRGHVASNGRSH